MPTQNDYASEAYTWVNKESQLGFKRGATHVKEVKSQTKFDK